MKPGSVHCVKFKNSTVKINASINNIGIAGLFYHNFGKMKIQ
jgi:hypothetical protein